MTLMNPLGQAQDPSRGTCRGARSGRSALTTTAVAGALIAGLWTAAPAAAHDQLLSAEPADGTTLEAAPQELLLTFSGSLITGQGIQNLVRVTDASGNQWQDGDASVTGPTLSAQLCSGMPNGEYDVAYRVVYSDGHSEEKQYAFTVEDPDGPDTGAPADGCGVTAAGAPGSDSPTAAASPSPTTATSGSAEASPDAAETPEDSDTVAEDQAGQDAGAVPAWVWAMGFGGVAVVVLGLVVAIRRAKSLG